MVVRGKELPQKWVAPGSLCLVLDPLAQREEQPVNGQVMPWQ